MFTDDSLFHDDAVVTARIFDGERAQTAHAVTLRVAADALVIQSKDGTALACWLLNRIDCPDRTDPDGKVVSHPKGDPRGW